jgi:hypothetical protein
MRKVSAKTHKPRNERKSHLLTFGQREIETHGLDTGFRTDLYHRSVTVYWPVFFGSFASNTQYDSRKFTWTDANDCACIFSPSSALLPRAAAIFVTLNAVFAFFYWLAGENLDRFTVEPVLFLDRDAGHRMRCLPAKGGLE